MKPKTVKYILISLGALALIYGIYRIVKRGNQSLPYDQGGSGSGNNGQSNCNQDFPLKKGSCGDRVLLLNSYLGLGYDSHFTKETENALYERSGIEQVTKEQFQKGTSGYSWNLEI